jgi:hypothetical protein
VVVNTIVFLVGKMRGVGILMYMNSSPFGRFPPSSYGREKAETVSFYPSGP